MVNGLTVEIIVVNGLEVFNETFKDTENTFFNHEKQDIKLSINTVYVISNIHLKSEN